MYYKLFINWTNQKIKQTFVTRNMFDLRHVRPFEKSYAWLYLCLLISFVLALSIILAGWFFSPRQVRLALLPNLLIFLR